MIETDNPLSEVATGEASPESVLLFTVRHAQNPLVGNPGAGLGALECCVRLGADGRHAEKRSDSRC